MACGSTPAPSPAPDASSPDVAVDAAPDAPAPDRPARTCPAEDLSSMQPGSDGFVRVMGDTSDSELTRYGTLASNCFSGGMVGRFALYSYTMRAAGSLRVSTANRGTSTSFDTFVAVLSSCISTARSIACNDNGAGATTSPRHSITQTAALAAGERVFILVGGRGAAASSIAAGPFELSLREYALGALDGPCRLSGSACDTGLLCTAVYPTSEAQGVCRRPVPAGMPCVAGTLCARGASCIANPGSTTMGTCMMDGASGGVCNVGRTPCGAGLTCTVPIPAPDSTGLCRPTLMPGAECDPSLVTGVCAAGSSCRQAPTARNPGRYQCFATGTQGGLCRAASPRCDGMLECSSATPATCRAQAAMGAACDVTGNADYCAAGSSCAPDMAFAAGTCAPDGTAPGTACRAAEPRCDAMLTCGAFGGRNICRREVMADQPCDYRNGSAFCPMGASCLPAGPSRGQCAQPVAETEPNNSPAAGQGPLMQGGIFTGSITQGSDPVDCYRFTVPMGASLFVEASTPNCASAAGGDPVVTVYNAANMGLAQNDDIASNNVCSRLNGLQSGPLFRMAAGTYAVCVQSYNAAAPVPQYQLTVAVVGATN